MCMRPLEMSVNIVQEAATILGAYGEPMSASDICRIMNKQVGRLRFTQYWIAYELKHDDNFIETGKRIFALKSWSNQA